MLYLDEIADGLATLPADNRPCGSPRATRVYPMCISGSTGYCSSVIALAALRIASVTRPAMRSRPGRWAASAGPGAEARTVACSAGRCPLAAYHLANHVPRPQGELELELTRIGADDDRIQPRQLIAGQGGRSAGHRFRFERLPAPARNFATHP